jgi:hypothetical protein
MSSPESAPPEIDHLYSAGNAQGEQPAEQSEVPSVKPDEDNVPSANPVLSGLDAGSVFVRKSAALPVCLPSVEYVTVSGWTWPVGVTETQFQAALREIGWKWFYLGDVVTVKAFGRPQAETMERLVEKALIAIHRHNPNTFTVTEVKSGNTLGFKTVSLSVQARHMQRGIPSGMKTT